MSESIKAFFSTITTFFVMCNRLMTAGDNVAKVAEQSSEDYYNQSKLEGAAKTEELKRKLKELESTSSVNTTSP